jgi:hypothetical protein
MVERSASRSACADCRGVVPCAVPEIHLQYELDDDFPSPEEVANKRALQEQLAELGDIDGSGAGGGVIDLWVSVRDVEVALSRIRALLRAIGIAERTKIIPRLPRLGIQIRCDEQIRPDNGELPDAKLEEELRVRGVGTLRSSSIGLGAAEVELAVRDLSVAIEQVTEIANQLGIADYTWIASSEDDHGWRRVGTGHVQRFPIEDRSFSTRVLDDGQWVMIHARFRAPTRAEKEAIEQLVHVAGTNGGRVTYDELNDRMPDEATSVDDIDWFLTVLGSKGIEVVED